MDNKELVLSIMRIILACISFLLTTKVLSQPHYIDPAKLTWQDFRGLVKYDSGFTAYTRATFSLFPREKKDGRTKYEFKIEFLPDSSWVDWRSLQKLPKPYWDSLFRHELLHYYITIISFKRAKLKFHRDQFYSLQEAFVFLEPFADMHKNMNDQYDAETRHSTNKIKQREWDEKITKMYNSLRFVKITLSGT